MQEINKNPNHDCCIIYSCMHVKTVNLSLFWNSFGCKWRRLLSLFASFVHLLLFPPSSWDPYDLYSNFFSRSLYCILMCWFLSPVYHISDPVGPIFPSSVCCPTSVTSPLLYPDMIFVKPFTRPKFLGQQFTQKRVNHYNSKFATKVRKYCKWPFLRQNSTNNI